MPLFRMTNVPLFCSLAPINRIMCLNYLVLPSILGVTIPYSYILVLQSHLPHASKQPLPCSKWKCIILPLQPPLLLHQVSLSLCVTHSICHLSCLSVSVRPSVYPCVCCLSAVCLHKDQKKSRCNAKLAQAARISMIIAPPTSPTYL